MTIGLVIAAFVMGLLGSPHCLGMCGGIVTAFGLQMQGISPSKRRGLVVTYHLGRLISYAVLGIIAGLIGTTVLKPLMMGNAAPRILLGIVLVIVGVAMLGLPVLNKLEVLGMGLWQKLAPVRKKMFPLNTYPRALGAGLLWGYLPCGLVYGALMMAVVGHDIGTGAMLMFVFGLGTMPMLVATQGTVGWLHKQIGKFRLRQLNGVIMVLSGVAVIVIPAVMSAAGGHGSHAGHNMNHSEHPSSMQMNEQEYASKEHAMGHSMGDAHAHHDNQGQ